jgi:putative transposase
MTSVRRIQLNLSEEEAAILDSQSKICNWLYNHLLSTANDLKAEYMRTKSDKIAKTLYTQRGLRNLIPDTKKDNPFLKTVHSSPLKNAALRLSDSIQDYQDGKHSRRKGQQTGWPKFRAWKKKWFSLLYDEPKKGFYVNGTELKLCLGKNENGKQIRITLHLYEKFPTKFLNSIKNLRITRDGSKRYFAVFTIDPAMCAQKESQDPRIIAFDPNHKNLVYGVGTDQRAIEIQNLVQLKKMDTRIDELKSRRDKCKKKSIRVVRPDGTFYWKASRRWTFFNQRLDEAYRVRREQTKTFLYTLSNQICKQYDIVCMGDYTPRGGGMTTPMRRSMNNQSLIGRFKKTLEWVAYRSGKLYIEYNEKGTTRTCVDCHYVVPDGISPEIREWTCPNCGTMHIRDENAAQNGLVKTVREKLLLPRSGHRCNPLVAERWVWWVAPSGVLSASRGRDGLPMAGTARKLNRGNANPSILTENV